MLDLNKRSHRQRLWKLMKADRDRLSPFRIEHMGLVRQYVGERYGEESDDAKPVIVNAMAMTADAYTMSVAAQRPRVEITTHHRSLLGFASRFESSINHLIEEIDLETTLRRIVLDAFFSVGIAKVYRAPSGNKVPIANPDAPMEPGPYASMDQWREYQELQRVNPPNMMVDPGKAFVERVSIFDFIFDTTANHWEKIQYAAHEYRVPLDSLKDDERFDERVVDKTVASSKWARGSSFEEGDEEQPRHMTTPKGHQGDADELFPMVTLVDIWLPATNKWAVCVADQPDLQPLYYADWNGPRRGPFHLLGLLNDVPDNIMPVSPANHLANINLILNSVLRKINRQVSRQKTWTGYRDARDAAKVQSANDGDLVHLMDPRSVNTISSGGIDQQTWAYFQSIEALMSRYAGNLDAMMGLGPQSDTATQEQLVHTAVSGREAKMRHNVLKFTSKICEDLGLMMWNDHWYESSSMANLKGLSLGGPVEHRWSPEEREGDFWQYNFEVDPSSMPYKSPAEKVTAVHKFLVDVLIPLGVKPNLEELVNLEANLIGLPQLRRVVDTQMPDTEPGPAGQISGGKPSSTTRTYERSSAAQQQPGFNPPTSLDGQMPGQQQQMAGAMQ